MDRWGMSTWRPYRGMHKTGCSGETKLILLIPSSLWAKKKHEWILSLQGGACEYLEAWVEFALEVEPCSECSLHLIQALLNGFVIT